MKIFLILIGKTDKAFYRVTMDEYCKRISHYIPFQTVIIPDVKNTKNISTETQKTLEGDQILKQLQPNDYIVLLDEKGKQFTSKAFAEYIEKKSHIVPKRLVFIIGGAYGFSEAIYAIAHEKIALSKMTFTHQMIRIIFTEQLYRAMSILNNEPYHHN